MPTLLVVDIHVEQARTTEKFEVVSSGVEKPADAFQDRLKYAKIEGPAVILAYIADDKNHVSLTERFDSPAHNIQQKEPLEAILRSLLLVFMDNATSEYTFITSFFISIESLSSDGSDNMTSLASPFPVLSPLRSAFNTSSDLRSTNAGSEVNFDSSRSGNGSPPPTTATFSSFGAALSREDQGSADTIWKQVLDPVLEYCQVLTEHLHLLDIL